MKVVQLTGSLSRLGGGVSEIMRSLAKEMNDLGHDVDAIGLADRHFAEDQSLWDPLEPKAFTRLCRGVPYVPKLKQYLAAIRPDVVHSHGVWNYPSYVAHCWRSETSGVHVITPQGMLEPWARNHKAFRKSVAWKVFEKDHFTTASCINVNSEHEMQNLRQLGIAGPFCVVPNGVKIPTLPASFRDKVRPLWADTWPAERKILLFLSRVHQKKGLIPLLRGWRMAQNLNSDHGWALAIVGWDENGFGKEINDEIAELRLQDCVKWFGPAFGETKLAAFHHATAYILPSFSEGFPMTVLEAWSHGLPVLMTPECNMNFGFEADAAIKVLPSEESISGSLLRLFTSEEEKLRQQGAKGRALVERNYSWRRVSVDLLSVYSWCLGAGPKPDFVDV